MKKVFKAKKTNKQVAEEVTAKIVAAMEAGVVPWKKPWKTPKDGFNPNLPHNAITGNTYRGFNQLQTMLEAWKKAYQSCGWLTFNQIKANGGYVYSGEKSTPIMHYHEVTKFVKVDENGRKWTADKNDADTEEIDEGETYTFLSASTWNMFNLDQCGGLDNLVTPEPTDTEPLNVLELGENVINAYINSDNAPSYHLNGYDRAYYRPSTDSIHLPEKAAEVWNAPQDFYTVAYHEMTHSTGHESRLNRDGVTGGHRFGSKDYGFEELVAELGSSFLCAHTGINDTIERHAGYLKNWLTVLKNDPSMIIKASNKAQKAVDFILAPKIKQEEKEKAAKAKKEAAKAKKEEKARRERGHSSWTVELKGAELEAFLRAANQFTLKGG